MDARYVTQVLHQCVQRRSRYLEVVGQTAVALEKQATQRRSVAAPERLGGVSYAFVLAAHVTKSTFVSGFRFGTSDGVGSVGKRAFLTGVNDHDVDVVGYGNRFSLEGRAVQEKGMARNPAGGSNLVEDSTGNS